METWDIALHTVVTGVAIYLFFRFYDIYKKYQQLLKRANSVAESKNVFIYCNKIEDISKV